MDIKLYRQIINFNFWY